MKQVSRSLLVATLIATAGGSIHAEEQDGGFVFGKIDQNGDGAVTRSELAAFSTTRFAAIDSDNDGSISAGELTRAAEERAAIRSKRHFASLDKNGDGSVAKTEFETHRNLREAQIFARFDKNGDGELDRKELREAYRHNKRHN